jgi:hypothetical protein
MNSKSKIVSSLLILTSFLLVFFIVFSSINGSKEFNEDGGITSKIAGRSTVGSLRADQVHSHVDSNAGSQVQRDIFETNQGSVIKGDFLGALLNELKIGSVDMREAIRRCEELEDQQKKEQAFLMLGKFFAENQGLELLQYSLELKPNANRERLLSSFMQAFQVKTVEEFDFLHNWFSNSGLAEDETLVMSNLSSLIRSLKYDDILALNSRSYVGGFKDISQTLISTRAVEDLIPSSNPENLEANLKRLAADFDMETKNRYLEMLAYNVTISQGEEFLPLVEKLGYNASEFLYNMAVTNTNSNAKKSFPGIIKLAENLAADEAVKHAARAWILEDSLEFSDYYIKNLQASKYSRVIVDAIVEYLAGKGDAQGAEQWRKFNN